MSAALAIPSQPTRVVLKELSEQHKQVAALMAQGIRREQISEITGYKPSYLSYLTSDPLFKEYLRDMTNFASAQIEAQFCQVAEVIRDGLTDGNKMEDRLKAARLQLEVTGRIGKGDRPPEESGSIERLTNLAERLLSLQAGFKSSPTTIDVVPTSGD